MGTKLDLMQRFLSHFATGDWEGACRTYVSEDFECLEPPELPQGGTFKGYDASIVISNIYRDIWDIEILDHKFWDDEASDILVSCYTIKWTSKKTGRSMTQPVMEQNTIRDEKIRRMQVFHFDAAGLLSTLDR
jgi:ketosteroid isomerase-like protein